MGLLESVVHLLTDLHEAFAVNLLWPSRTASRSPSGSATAVTAHERPGEGRRTSLQRSTPTTALYRARSASDRRTRRRLPARRDGCDDARAPRSRAMSTSDDDRHPR